MHYLVASIGIQPRDDFPLFIAPNSWLFTVFASRLQDTHETTTEPTLPDIERHLGRLSFASDCYLTVEGGPAIDGGMELYGAGDGIAIIGAEDSMRGTFAFLFVDPDPKPEPRKVDIFDISSMNVCSSLDAVRSIARTYALTGELDRKFNWSLNISVGNITHYHCKLEQGDARALSKILESAPDLPRWIKS